ncbi:carboxy terminal-processing peptidase, partial [Mucilaginibacter sp. 5B2]|nr:carboxy terminal-processing peptidase [Mucilaginibacter sp. 5B2]
GEKSVTLNEQKLKQERDADEQKAFEHNNLRRVALGLSPLKKGQVKPKNEDTDFLQKEAGQVLTDYLTLGSKLTTVKPAGTN